MSPALVTAIQTRLSSRTGGVVVVLVAVLLAAGLRAVDANPATAQTVSLQAYQTDEDPGTDPTTGVWRSVPSVEIPLSAQMVTFPTGGELSVDAPTARARALHDGDTLFIALDWPDSTSDDTTAAPEEFADAAAVQFPGEPTSSVPSVCMGQADQNVNIWHWRADSQTGVPEVPSSGYVDRYPSTDELHYPARSAGNPYAQPGEGAAQNLVAGGFGTLTLADGQTVHGHGTHHGERWSVVFTRDYPAPGPLQPTFETGQVIDIAFAVWNGALDQRDGLKSTTSFVKLELTDSATPGQWAPSAIIAALALVVLGGILAPWVLRRRAVAATEDQE